MMCDGLARLEKDSKLGAGDAGASEKWSKRPVFSVGSAPFGVAFFLAHHTPPYYPIKQQTDKHRLATHNLGDVGKVRVSVRARPWE